MDDHHDHATIFISNFAPHKLSSLPLTTIMKCELKVIPPTTVAEHPGDFNSAFHKVEELPLLEDDRCSHLHHDLSLTFFGRHRQLVLASRRINSSKAFVSWLSPTIIETILEMSNLAILTGRIPRDDLEDLASLLSQHAFPPTIPQYGWFVRLDAVSPKDSINSGQPVKTPIDLVYALATSRRALSALQDGGRWSNWTDVQLKLMMKMCGSNLNKSPIATL